MDLNTFILVCCVGIPIYFLYNYKFATYLTNAYLYRKLGGVVILLMLSIAERWYFNGSVMSFVLMLVLLLDVVKFFCLTGIIGFIVFTKKISSKERFNYRLFFTNLTVRIFYKSENPNVYFLTKNGIRMYFDSASDCFESLSDTSLERFKKGMKTEKLENFSLNNFLVLLYDNQYLSVSSADLTLLGVDFLEIDKSHFEVLRMFKI